MKHTTWRQFLLLTLSGLLILTGCAGNEQQTVYESSTYISFSWWGNDSRHQYTLEAVDTFMEQNDGAIRVNTKYSNWGGYENRMRIYMKSHNAPDVMQINYAWLSEYSSDGTGFYDLYELSDQIDLSNYTEAELSFGIVDGKLNAIPIAFNTPIFYHNKSLYDSYGLSLPTTWDDLFAAAEVMKADDVYPLGAPSKQLFLMLTAYFEQTTGKSATNEDGDLTFTKDDIGYMLDFYKELIDEHVLLPIDEFSINSFSTCQTASSLAWISDAANYCDTLQENGYTISIGEYICDPDATLFGWSVKPATLYAISNTTDYPKEAAELLNYLLNGSEMALLQGTEKGIPISDAARNVLEENGMMDTLEKEADDMREAASDQLDILAPVLEDEDVYTAFKENADYYLYGKLSRDEVVEQIYASFYGE